METIPDFEYDPAKSQANFEKHGIDFGTAQMIWLDARAIDGEAIFYGEPRRLMIGSMAGKCWTVVFTLRDRTIRIISARRSRAIEVKAYDNQKDHR